MKRILILLAVILVAVVLETHGESRALYEVEVYPVVSCGNPDIVFTYTFYSQAAARTFARTVAHQGLERILVGTTPKAASTLILYPTIRRIKVRRTRRAIRR